MNKTLMLQTTTACMFLGLVACSGQQDQAGSSGTAARSTTVVVEQPVAVCGNCGVVSSISTVTNPGTGTGAGAAIGAIVGGLAGHQVGGGNGKKIATVAGVIGGALAGNKVESKRNDTTYYEITIAMDNGSQRVITVPDANGVGPGSPVRVDGDNISLR